MRFFLTCTLTLLLAGSGARATEADGDGMKLAGKAYTPCYRVIQ